MKRFVEETGFLPLSECDPIPEISDAYYQGFYANCEEGLDSTENPFPNPSVGYDEWESGWVDAEFDTP